MANELGTVCDGKYQLRCKVGEGTYGRVYFARHVRTREAVAIKIMMDKDEDISHSTIREVCILRRLGNHPNLPRIHEIYRTPRHEIGVVMEWLGRDLREVLGGGALRMGRIKHIVRGTLRALAHCHIRSVLHRDVKPSNILLTGEDRVTLCDFGLARVYYPGTDARYTREVVSMWYRAPELLMGWRQYNGAIDMWAMGAIVVEMLTGRPLFVANKEVDLFVEMRKVMGCPDPDDTPPGMELPKWATDDRESWTPMDWVDVVGSKHAESPVLDFLEAVMQYNPLRRMTAYDALHHPWLAS